MNRYTRPITIIPAHEIARLPNALFVNVYRNPDCNYQPGSAWHSRADADASLRTMVGIGRNAPLYRFRVVPRGCFA